MKPSPELVSVTISNAIYVGLSLAWFHSVRYNNGTITWQVNGLGEGILEAILFFGLWVLSTWALVNIKRKASVGAA